VLLAGEQLIVLTEQGEVVLAEASTEKYRELASLQALDDSETCWNNPTLVGDLLLVRNGAEAAAFRLPLSGASSEEAVAVR
jgi:outer membrane protein assembly factor BamB